MSKKVNRLRGRLIAAEDALYRAEADRERMLREMARLQQLADNAVKNAEEKLKGACCFVRLHENRHERKMILSATISPERYLLATIGSGARHDVRQLAREVADVIGQEAGKLIMDEAEKMFGRRT